MIDIVFPKNNEEEFISLAEQLDLEGLLFVYSSRKDISNYQKKTKLKLFSTTAKKVIDASTDSRTLLEKNKNCIFYNFEKQERDFLKQRNSGLNHILTKIAKQNKNIIGLSLSLYLDKKNLEILARFLQNIKLIRKAKSKLIIGSFSDNPWQMRAEKDLQNFLSFLGFDSKDISPAFLGINDIERLITI